MKTEYGERLLAVLPLCNRSGFPGIKRILKIPFWMKAGLHQLSLDVCVERIFPQHETFAWVKLESITCSAYNAFSMKKV